MKSGTFYQTCNDEGCPHHGTPHVCNPIKGSVVYEAGTDAELHVIHYRTADGHETMLTHWYPDEDDIRAMIEGKPVALHIVGTRHPWVKVEVSK